MNFLEGCALAAAIVYRSVPDALMEKRAEGTRTLKADFKADVGNADSARPEKLFGLLNSFLNQVLPRRGVKGCAKRSQEMVLGHAGLFGDFVQIKWLIVTFVHKLACPPESFAQVVVGYCRNFGFVSHRGFDLQGHIRARFYCESRKSERPDYRFSLARIFTSSVSLRLAIIPP